MKVEYELLPPTPIPEPKKINETCALVRTKNSTVNVLLAKMKNFRRRNAVLPPVISHDVTLVSYQSWFLEEKKGLQPLEYWRGSETLYRPLGPASSMQLPMLFGNRTQVVPISIKVQNYHKGRQHMESNPWMVLVTSLITLMLMYNLFIYTVLKCKVIISCFKSPPPTMRDLLRDKMIAYRMKRYFEVKKRMKKYDPVRYTHVSEAEQQIMDEMKIQSLDITAAEQRIIDDMNLQSMDDFGTAFQQIFKNLGVEGPYAGKLFEDIMVLIFHLSRSTDKVMITMAIVTFAKLRSKNALVLDIYQKLIKRAYEMYLAQDVQSAEDVLETMRCVVDGYEGIKHSALVKKIHLFTSYVLGVSVFDKLGMKIDSSKMDVVMSAVDRENLWNRGDFIHCLLDTSLFICERGYQCYHMGSVQPLFHSGKNYDEWFKSVIKLKRWSTVLSNPKPHGFTRFQFDSELDDAIEKGQSITAYLNNLGEWEKRLGKTALDDLRMIKTIENTKKGALKERKAPFGLLLYGGSGVMKSTFSNLLFNHYGKVFDLPVTSEYKYVRNPVDPFWSGFATSMWCVQLDDVAALKPAAVVGVDPSIAEIIQIQNNVAFVPTQAELCDKGKTPVQARLVIANTNTEDINAFAYFENELAIRRRLPLIIHIEPKPNFANGPMIDTKKVPVLAPGEYPDVWLIKVSIIEPAGSDVRKQRAKTRELANFSSIYEFLHAFNAIIKEYELIQDKADRETKIMADVVLCKDCDIPEAHCICAHLQSVDEISEVVEEQVVDPRVVDEEFTSPEKVEKPIPEFPDGCVVVELSAGNPNGVVVLLEGLRFHISHTMWEHAIHIEDRKYAIPEYIMCQEAPGVEDSHPYADYADVIIAYFDNVQRNRMGFGDFFLMFCIKTVALVYCRSKFVRASITWLMGWGWIRHRCIKFVIKYTPYHIRAVMMCLAHVANKRFGVPKTLVHLITVFTGAIATYAAIKTVKRLWNGPDTPKAEIEAVPQVKVTVGTRPVPMQIERENVWQNEDLKLAKFDVSQKSRSYKRFSLEEVENMLAPNMVHLNFRHVVGDRLATRSNKGLCVGGHIYVTNNHCVPPGAEIDLEVIMDNVNVGVTPNMRFMLSSSEIVRRPEMDLAFLRIRNTAPRKSIVDLFPVEALQGVFEGELFARTDAGFLSRNRVENVRYSPCMRIAGLSTIMDVYNVWCEKLTENGDCGSLLLVKSDLGVSLLGMHVLGGKTNNSSSVSVTQEDIKSAMAEFGGIHIQSGTPMLSAPSAPRPIVPLHYKCAANYLTEGTARVYGSFAGFRSAHKSSVKPTFIQEAVAKRGVPVENGPPVMNSWKPWHLAIKDMVKPVTHIKQSVLKQCVEGMKIDIERELPSDQWKLIEVYDLHTAINGADGVAYVDKLNRNTSAGNPWKKCKKNFLIEVPDSTDVEIKTEIRHRVDEIQEKYRSGERVMPNFCAHLKDEAKSFAKIRDAKTRVMFGGPMDWSIVVRMYMLSLVRVIQNNKFVFEMAPGTVAQSCEWGEIRAYLTKFGLHRMIAGDYAKYDKTMPAPVILAAFDILIWMVTKAGYTEDQLKVVCGIAEDVAFPLIDFNGDIIEFMGSNPSGHPLTVVINSLANSLYMRYAYIELNPKSECLTFRERVALMTYGDDNALGVSNIIDWYNHTSIQAIFASVGITYTMADKEAASIPFIHIDDISFLKRKWRYDDEVGDWLCPLEESSIHKMLTTGIKSDNITPKAHAIAIIGTALREYFFYGREEFEKQRAMLAEVVEECGLHIYVNEYTLPKFEDLIASHHKSSERVRRSRRGGETPRA